MLCTLRKILGENDLTSKYNSRPGPKSKFTDLEVIALSLAADSIGISSENHLFMSLSDISRESLPHLLSRRQYHDRRKKLMNEIKDLQKVVADELNKKETLFIIDSTPLRLCKIARMYRNKIGVADLLYSPNAGYCAAQKEKYFGYKLHVICSSNGVIHQADITEASMHDVNYLHQHDTNLRNCTLTGDLGYVSNDVKEDLLKNFNIEFLVPTRKTQKVQVQLPCWISGKRKKIETIFSQLNDQFNLQRHYAKTLIGYMVRLQSKLCSLTLLQFINERLIGKPIGKVKYTLCHHIE